MPPTDSKYLRLADLARLKRLLFASRRPVVGRYSGRHASMQRGRSVEFNDYRQYYPGDPLAGVDWKTYGRSDRLYVKLFENQSDMAVNLLVDASASMAYGAKSQGVPPKVQTITNTPSENPAAKITLASSPLTLSKFDHAARLAAATAFLATRQGDRVSFAMAMRGLRGFQPPSSAPSQLRAMLDALEAARPISRADLPAAIRQMAGAVPRHGLFIVLSDLLDDQAETLAALSLVTHRGGQVVLFHIVHPDELHLPDLPDALFIDSESPRSVAVGIDELRGEYEERMKQFIQSWTTACAQRGMDYKLIPTNTPYERALEDYLHARASRA